MGRVLILTRNILAEQRIQQQLQMLNYEVYCSAAIFDYCSQHLEKLNFFDFFQFVILSESICESEMLMLIPLLEEYPLNIIRKTESDMTEIDQKYMEAGKLNAIVSTNDSTDKLRECLYNLKGGMNDLEEKYSEKNSSEQHGTPYSVHPNSLLDFSRPKERHDSLFDVVNHLSQSEKKILSTLTWSEEEVITREEMCQKVWNEKANSSHLASLSSSVTRIKNKFNKTNLDNDAIHTVWGRGYRINSELLKTIKSEERFLQVVSNNQTL